MEKNVIFSILIITLTANGYNVYAMFFPMSPGVHLSIIDFTLRVIKSHGELIYYLDSIDGSVRQLLLGLDAQYNLLIRGTLNASQMKMEDLCKMKISDKSVNMSIVIRGGVNISCNRNPEKHMGHFDRKLPHIGGSPRHNMEKLLLRGYCHFGEMSLGSRVRHLEARITNIVVTGYMGNKYPFPDINLTLPSDRGDSTKHELPVTPESSRAPVDASSKPVRVDTGGSTASDNTGISTFHKPPVTSEPLRQRLGSSSNSGLYIFIVLLVVIVLWLLTQVTNKRQSWLGEMLDRFFYRVLLNDRNVGAVRSWTHSFSDLCSASNRRPSATAPRDPCRNMDMERDSEGYALLNRSGDNTEHLGPNQSVTAPREGGPPSRSIVDDIASNQYDSQLGGPSIAGIIHPTAGDRHDGTLPSIGAGNPASVDPESDPRSAFGQIAVEVNGEHTENATKV